MFPRNQNSYNMSRGDTTAVGIYKQQQLRKKNKVKKTNMALTKKLQVPGIIICFQMKIKK